MNLRVIEGDEADDDGIIMLAGMEADNEMDRWLMGGGGGEGVGGLLVLLISASSPAFAAAAVEASPLLTDRLESFLLSRIAIFGLLERFFL